MRVGTTAYRYQPPICRSLAGIPDTPSSRQISKHLGFLLHIYWFCALRYITAFKALSTRIRQSPAFFSRMAAVPGEKRGVDKDLGFRPLER